MDKYCQKNPELQKKSQLDEKTVARIRRIVEEELGSLLLEFKDSVKKSLESTILESHTEGDNHDG